MTSKQILLLGMALTLFGCQSTSETGPAQKSIDKAMEQMDQGLRQAFEVDTEFLKQLDVRLPKLYSEMFIPGVQSYRLGVESSDRGEQIEGLNLLRLWGQFWVAEKRNIQNRLIELQGK